MKAPKNWIYRARTGLRPIADLKSTLSEKKKISKSWVVVQSGSGSNSGEYLMIPHGTILAIIKRGIDSKSREIRREDGTVQLLFQKSQQHIGMPFLPDPILCSVNAMIDV